MLKKQIYSIKTTFEVEVEANNVREAERKALEILQKKYDVRSIHVSPVRVKEEI